ncbi:MAG: sigma-70 family RNA polymerase sigma factor [Candidatus Hydrothermae bacterium]|nr:sigma-70 family RNA polymerase sigma factor [Candidatus Hydrothermae bacterium]
MGWETHLGASRAGDTRARDALLRDLRPELYAYFLRVIHNPEDAEDLTQEALLRVLEVLPRLDPERNPRAYVFRICHNLAMDHFRRNARAPRSLEALEREPSAPPKGYTLESLRVERVLTRLRPEDREILLLREREGLPPRELATVLGCSPEAARVRLHRARRRFLEVWHRLYGQKQTS